MSNTILDIAGTIKTPAVNFNPNGTLSIMGRAIPENTLEFFRPLVEWIEGYAKSPSPTTNLDLRIQYINTSATKSLLELLRLLETVAKAGSKVSVKWVYAAEDEDMLEMGEDFKLVVKVPFELSKVDSL